MTPRTRIIARLSFLSLLVSAGSAWAADTVEPLDVGFSDAEFYVGVDGLGTVADKTLYGQLALGVGLTERLSLIFGATLAGTHHLDGGTVGLALNLYGNVLDTNHVDLDLFFDVSAGGDGFSEFSLGPSFELNVDLDKDMQGLGFYLRGGVPLTGMKLDPVDPTNADEAPRYKTIVNIETTLGAYYRIKGDHQLLLEFDMAFNPDPAADERGAVVGGLAFGYNVAIHDAIEMINQVYLDIPQSGERTSINLMTGILVTLPSAKK